MRRRADVGGWTPWRVRTNCQRRQWTWDFVTRTYRTYPPRLPILVRRPPIVSTVADRGPLTSPTRTPLGFVNCAPSRGRWTGNTKPRRWHPPPRHATSRRSGTTEIDGDQMNKFFTLRGRLDNGPSTRTTRRRAKWLALIARLRSALGDPDRPHGESGRRPLQHRRHCAGRRRHRARRPVRERQGARTAQLEHHQDRRHPQRRRADARPDQPERPGRPAPSMARHRDATPPRATTGCTSRGSATPTAAAASSPTSSCRTRPRRPAPTTPPPRPS